jgi:hypothetical protein
MFNNIFSMFWIKMTLYQKQYQPWFPNKFTIYYNNSSYFPETMKETDGPTARPTHRQADSYIPPYILFRGIRNQRKSFYHK